MNKVDYQPTPLGYALLGLIYEKPSSGYDIRKVIDADAIGGFSSSPGAIYPALNHLRKWGLIDGIIEQRTRLKPREVFQLTALGLTHLKKWLAKRLTVHDVRNRMPELTLKFRLMNGLMSREDILRFLELFRREANAACLVLLAAKDLSAPQSLHTRLCSDHELALYQAHIEWAKKAIEELSAEMPKDEPADSV